MNFLISEKITRQLQLSHSASSPLLHLQKINAERLQLYRHLSPESIAVHQEPETLTSSPVLRG